MKKSISRIAILIGIGLGAMVALSDRAPEAGTPDLFDRVIAIAEEIESRKVEDVSGLSRSTALLGTACAEYAQAYTDYGYAAHMLKVAEILGEEVRRPDRKTRHEMLSRIGTRYLDEGCPTGLMLQLIQRQKSVERFVDGALYALAEAKE